MPSALSPSHSSVETTGLRCIVRAEAFTRAQCKSRSGETPSNVRAPSNTEEHSHAEWLRTPMIGRLPSCQSPSQKVQVFDHCPAAIPALPSRAFMLLLIIRPHGANAYDNC